MAHVRVEQMHLAGKLQRSAYASAIEEAQHLVRRCAEPRPAGDLAKAAILRASRRLGFTFSRTKDIWYGDARRIVAEEMDKLRQVAEHNELTHAVAAVEVLRNKLLASSSPASLEVVAGLSTALQALDHME